MKFDIKKILLHLGVAVGFLIVSAMFFAPIAFEGKTLQEHDNVASRGMQTEIWNHYHEKGELIKWTNQNFFGMPTYQLTTVWGTMNPILQMESRVVRLNQGLTPYVLMYLMMLGAYLGMLVLGLPIPIAIALALSYGFLTSHILYYPAGHSTKLLTIAYIAPTIAFFIATFRKNILLGSAFFAFFLALQLNGKHVQMTYYMYLGFIIMGITLLVEAIKNQTLPHFIKASGALIVATLIGVGVNLTQIWTTMEYAAESTRGKSDLTLMEKRDGLKEDYVYDYSFEQSEILTIMFPNFYGTSDFESFVQDSEGNLKEGPVLTAVQNPSINQGFNQAMQKAMASGDRQAANRLRGLIQYRGTQRLSGGPLYYGVGFCFLFIFGLILVPGGIKFGILGMFLFFAILSMGDNFPVISDLMYNYFPMYNKFRDTKMVLLVAEGFMVLLSALGIRNLLEFKAERYEGSLAAKILASRNKEVTATNMVLVAGGMGLSLCLLVLLYGLLGSPTASYDVYLAVDAPQLLEALYAERSALITKDAMVGAALVALVTALLYALASKKLSVPIFAVVVGLVLCIDELRMDRKYINENSYYSRQEVFEQVPSAASAAINNADKSYHRVIDFSHGAPSQKSDANYFHKNLGGYHAAKPRLYQEFWAKYNLDNPNAALSPIGETLLGMMNAKYYILPPSKELGQTQPVHRPNTKNLGAAWLVDEIKVVNSSDEEIEMTGTINPKTTAVTKAKAYVEGVNNQPSATDKIELTAYHPECMTYQATTTNERFALFSEIYYPPSKGWNVYINGERVDDAFVRCNYLIRGMKIPAGTNTIEMKFEPTSYSLGEWSSLICSLLIFAGMGWSFYQYSKEDEEPLSEGTV